jgi:hypothetical protein
MKKIVLTFGVISGVVISALMLGTLPFQHQIGFERAMIVGYTTMVASFLLVYFGIRSYRNNVGGGRITFGRGFAVGILITLITCVFYVATWEVMFHFFMPNFMNEYTAHEVAKVQASGASAAAIQAKTAQLEQAAVSYNNIWLNMAMTFIEPFPVGLLITLISAAVLRKAGVRDQGSGVRERPVSESAS